MVELNLRSIIYAIFLTSFLVTGKAASAGDSSCIEIGALNKLTQNPVPSAERRPLTT